MHWASLPGFSPNAKNNSYRVIERGCSFQYLIHENSPRNSELPSMQDMTLPTGLRLYGMWPKQLYYCVFHTSDICSREGPARWWFFDASFSIFLDYGGTVVQWQNARLSRERPGFEPSWLLFLVALGKPLYRRVLPGLAVKDIVWLNNSTSAI